MSPDAFEQPTLNAARIALRSHQLPTWCDPSRLAFVLHLDEASPSNNTLKGMHRFEYKKLREGFAVKVRGALAGRQPLQLAWSALYVVRRSAGHLDWDNALGGLKPILDCLVAPSARNPSGLHIIQDDNPDAMPHPPYMRQLPAKRGQGSTQVYIFAVDKPAS